MKTLIEQGVCPKCGSLNIDYWHIKEHNDLNSELVTDQGVYYPATCLDCGHRFKEIYELSFVGCEDDNITLNSYSITVRKKIYLEDVLTAFKTKGAKDLVTEIYRVPNADETITDWLNGIKKLAQELDKVVAEFGWKEGEYEIINLLDLFSNNLAAETPIDGYRRYMLHQLLEANYYDTDLSKFFEQIEDWLEEEKQKHPHEETNENENTPEE